MTAGHGPTRPVVVVGDVGLDVITRPSGDIRWHSDTPSAVALVPGGAGGNSASWLAGLGAEVTLVARVGDDAAGTACRGELEAAGVTCAFAVDPALPTCMVVILLDAHGDRTMFPDRGANRAFSVADVDLASLGLPLDPRPHLHLSGYVLFDAGSRAAGLESLRQAQRAGMDDVGRPAVAGAHRAGGGLGVPVVGLGGGPAAAQRERGRGPRRSGRDPRARARGRRHLRRGRCAVGRCRRRRVGRGAVRRRTSTPPGAATPSTPGCSRPGCAARTGPAPCAPGWRPAAPRQPAWARDPADRHTPSAGGRAGGRSPGAGPIGRIESPKVAQEHVFGFRSGRTTPVENPGGPQTAAGSIGPCARSRHSSGSEARPPDGSCGSPWCTGVTSTPPSKRGSSSARRTATTASPARTPPRLLPTGSAARPPTPPPRCTGAGRCGSRPPNRT